MTRRLICATLVAASAAWAQAPSPAFEVASVRQSPPNPPGTPNPPISEIGNGRVKFHLQMQGLICEAYGVRANQVVGPAWLTTARFDIEAKLPAGATVDQVPAMLQTLLADRFKMTVHRESREESVLALVVAKDGLKLKPRDAATGEVLPPAGKRDGCYPHAGQPAAPAAGSAANAKDDPKRPAALGQILSTITNGDMTMVTGMNGSRVEMARIPSLVEWLGTMAPLLRALSGGGPAVVIDKTNLTGEYEIVLQGTAAAADITPPQPGQPAAPLGAPWFVGALEKLGLKLEQQKAPVETIVIDHIEMTPTAN